MPNLYIVHRHGEIWVHARSTIEVGDELMIDYGGYYWANC